MIALQHFSSISEPPVGLWWIEDGKLKNHYAPGTEAYKVLGTQAMSKKLPEATWEAYFQSLEEVAPMVHGWETIDIFVSPQEWLTRVRKAAEPAPKAS